MISKTQKGGYMSDNYEELEKLNDLKQKGIITEEEFNAKKQEILGNKTGKSEPKKSSYESLKPHYQKVFRKFDAIVDRFKATNKVSKNFMSWNWAAFCFTALWALSKRQWFLAIFGILFAGLSFVIPYVGIGLIVIPLWADFFEYYKFKTGKTTIWSFDKAVREIAAMDVN